MSEEHALCQHGHRPLLSLHLRQRLLRLGQPERHVHSTVEIDGGGQGGVGLCGTAGLVVQTAQPVVAVGHERAHAQLVGQGQGLLVVSFGLHSIGRIGVGLDDAKLVQCDCLVPAFLELPGQVERLRACCRASSPYPARRHSSLSHATRRA